MKKLLFSNFLCLSCFLFFTNALLAAPIVYTGLGGNTNWSNPANWDTGTVPGPTDDVTIPLAAGVVQFNMTSHQVKTITIFAGSSLVIQGGKTLQLLDAEVISIYNYGDLVNLGTLEVNNSTFYGLFNQGFFNNQGLCLMANNTIYGIYNIGDLENEATGEMIFVDSGVKDIYALYGGALINEGVISCSGTGGLVFNGGFENKTSGTIELKDGYMGDIFISGLTGINNGSIYFENAQNSAYPFYLKAGSVFTNGSTGSIIYDELGGGIAGLFIENTATFENDGIISINNASGDGLICDGNLHNNPRAVLEFKGGNTGLSILAADVFVNEGVVRCEGLITGINNSGDILNKNGGQIDIHSVVIGLDNSPSGRFMNKKATIDFTLVGTNIFNEGTIVNKECGVFYLDDPINNNGGIFENYGWLKHLALSTDHIHTGNQIINYGIVVDPHNHFATALRNEETRVVRLVGAQANVPLSSALDIGIVTSSSITDFYLEKSLTTLAGTYDYLTNTYTPNNAAIGASILYASSTAGGLCSEVIEIYVDGTVAPITGGPQRDWSASYRSGVSAQADQKLKVFPNPSTGFVQVNLPEINEANSSLQMINAQGQLMLSRVLNAAEVRPISFDLNAYPVGIYFVRLVENGVTSVQEKVMVLR